MYRFWRTPSLSFWTGPLRGIVLSLLRICWTRLRLALKFEGKVDIRVVVRKAVTCLYQLVHKLQLRLPEAVVAVANRHQ